MALTRNSSDVVDYRVWNASTSGTTPTRLPVSEDPRQLALSLYVLPVIIAIGTFGNLMSFAVLMRSRMRHTSVYFYLKVLACADTSVLYVSGFKTFIRVSTGFELMHVSSAWCKTVYFILTFSMHLSAWTVVLMTFDRFVAVWFPFRATTMCSFGRAKIVTIITVIVLALYNIHFFWTVELWQPKNRTLPVCGSGPGVGKATRDFMVGMYEYVKLCTYTLLPFFIILFLNIAIIVRLRWSSPILRRSYGEREQLEVTVSSIGESSTMGRQARVTYMLLSVSFTWLLLTIPFALSGLMYNHFKFAKNQLFRNFCFLFMYANHAVNFYIYCITGRKFRKELRGLLTAVCGSRVNRKRSTYTSPSLVKTMQRTHLVDMELHEITAV